MSVQKKSLISQRAAVTKAIVATPEVDKNTKAKLSPRVMPKTGVKIQALIRGKVAGKVYTS